MKKRFVSSTAFTGLFAAIASSACCIPPLIALVAGIGTGASTLSWIEPARPYLISFAVLAIGYAWYRYYKQKKNNRSCGCQTDKPKFYQTKFYLISITVFALLSISIPYATGFFLQNEEKQISGTTENIKTIRLNVEGMTCTGCEATINHSISKLNGVLVSKASYKDETVTIQYDTTKVSPSKLKKAIKNAGYIIK